MIIIALSRERINQIGVGVRDHSSFVLTDSSGFTISFLSNKDCKLLQSGCSFTDLEKEENIGSGVSSLSFICLSLSILLLYVKLLIH